MASNRRTAQVDLSKVDLSKVDTDPVLHNAYVMVVGAADTAPRDVQTRGFTLKVLSYIQTRLPVFTKMGVKVKIHSIRKADLQKKALVDAMKKKKIMELPALVTPNGVYLGAAEIIQVYERNIQAYVAFMRREAETVQGAAPESDLDGYFRSEMSMERYNQEADGGDDGGIGDAAGMMHAFQSMVRRRETYDAMRNKQPGLGGAEGQTARSENSRSAPARPDNVDKKGEGPAGLGDIDALISQMAGNIDSQTIDTAFSGGGGDSYEDTNGTGSAQDDLMEKKYWANQEMSM